MTLVTKVNNMTKKYKLSFSSKVTKISNTEINKNISIAGLEKLRPLMPENINLDDNPDLMGIVLNAAVGNKSNRNHDAITNKTLVSIAKNFLYKQVDLNHSRKNNVGVIVNYGFSEFGTNKLLTAEEVENNPNPVNLSLAILVWTSVLDDKYIKSLEDSADENSPDFAGISASWEMWFDEYDIAVSEDGLITGAEIFSGPDAEKVDSYLPSNKGKGYINGKMVFRVLKHDENNIVLPAGIGLVEYPAAHVSGLEIINNSKETDSKANDLETNAQLKTEENNEEKGLNKKEKHMKNYGFCPKCNESSDDSEMENEEVTCGKCGEKTSMSSWTKDKPIVLKKSMEASITLKEAIKIMSKSNDNSVTPIKDLKNMNKPKSLKELTEANLKELSVAEVNDLVAEALREANKSYEADVNQHKNSIEQLTKEKEVLASTVSENADKLTKTENDLNQLKEQFNKLVEANALREQEVKFNERMTAIASKFDLSDKQKEVVVNRIKTIKTDEEFVSYASELDLFLVKKEDKAKEISTASVIDEEKNGNVDSALKNASKENVTIPNSQTAPLDFIALAQKAFSKENITITYSK